MRSRRFWGHPTCHLWLRLEKVGFRRSRGTLRRGPWGPGEVEMEFFFKILDGLDQTPLGTPHMPALASFEKIRFSEVWGTLWQGPWGPDEVKTEFFFSKFLTGLSRLFWGHPTCQLWLRLKKVGFRRSRGPFGGVPGDQVRSKWKNASKFLTGLTIRFKRHPICYI